MRRVVSVWFPHWPTDRLRRTRGPQGKANAAPLVTALHDGRKRVIVAADSAAIALGLQPGLAVAQALALVPELEVAEADHKADTEALRRLALWCHAVTPLAAPCDPDGLWLDVTGCVHEPAAEAALLQRLVARLARDGLQARAASADTPGCAHALARHGAHCTVVAPTAQAEALAPMPLTALRISFEMEATLRRLGFEQVAHLTRIPSALLARRFGPLLRLRLDQAYGRVQEPIEPLAPEHPLQHRLGFLEPLLTIEAFQAVVPRLVEPVCREMERLGVGARQVDLIFDRVDGHSAAIRIRTAAPSRDAAHLSRMLLERLETIDPGLGVEAMCLAISVTQRLDWEQQEDGAGLQEGSKLVDRLTNRLGAASVYLTAPTASDIPERITKPMHAAGATAKFAQVEQDPDPPSPEHGMLRRVRRNHLRLVEHAPTSTRQTSPPQITREATPLRLVGISTTTPKVSTAVLELVSHTRFGKPALQPWRAARWTKPKNKQKNETLEPHSLPDPLDKDPPLLPWLPKPNPHADVSPGSKPPWPNRLQAPSRLLAPPQAVKALAALPDGAPVAFTWRRRHFVRQADGPERVFGEWWRTGPEISGVRDYFIVEDENGHRYWLFRRGNTMDPHVGNFEWFLHGLF